MIDNISRRLKQLGQVHFFICIGLALIISVFYFVLYDVTKADDSLGLTFEFVVPLFAILSLSVGYFVNKQKLKAAINADTLFDKLELYRAGAIVKWATIEGAAFFACITYYLTQRNNFILYALMLGVYLIYSRPLKSRIIEDLELSEEEKDLINEI